MTEPKPKLLRPSTSVVLSLVACCCWDVVTLLIRFEPTIAELLLIDDVVVDDPIGPRALTPIGEVGCTLLIAAVLVGEPKLP